MTGPPSITGSSASPSLAGHALVRRFRRCVRVRARAAAGSDGVAGLRDWLLEVGAAGAALGEQGVHFPIPGEPEVHFPIHDEPVVHFPVDNRPAVAAPAGVFADFAWPAIERPRSRRWWRRPR